MRHYIGLKLFFRNSRRIDGSWRGSRVSGGESAQIRVSLNRHEKPAIYMATSV